MYGDGRSVSFGTTNRSTHDGTRATYGVVYHIKRRVSGVVGMVSRSRRECAHRWSRGGVYARRHVLDRDNRYLCGETTSTGVPYHGYCSVVLWHDAIVLYFDCSRRFQRVTGINRGVGEFVCTTVHSVIIIVLWWYRSPLDETRRDDRRNNVIIQKKNVLLRLRVKRLLNAFITRRRLLVLYAVRRITGARRTGSWDRTDRRLSGIFLKGRFLIRVTVLLGVFILQILNFKLERSRLKFFFVCTVFVCYCCSLNLTVSISVYGHVSKLKIIFIRENVTIPLSPVFWSDNFKLDIL